MKNLLILFLALPTLVIGQSKFAQLGTELPTPNVYRTAAGMPGHQYYQQKADYVMDITLDDEKQIIRGEETITYHNYSPDPLPYLWVQLDQNMRSRDSQTKLIEQQSFGEKESFYTVERLKNDFDGGFKIESVKDAQGAPMDYTVVHTMMRIEMPKPLQKNESVSFSIKYWYNINNRAEIGGRSGYEYFEEEDNYLYTIAQFFPRMCVYNDVEGWQNKQFLGRGEFTLPFGDYRVSITVPTDHIVAATGVNTNAEEVLTAVQKERWAQAKNSDKPVEIVTEAEAKKAEKKKASGTKTWIFEAENVRDFAFASSRKFIWDAMGVEIGDKTVMAMSYYPKEGNPLWGQYSTEVVAHTVRTYSKFTTDYTYPVAISVHTDRIGMEYPMICFNGGRPEPDGTYSANTKHGMISVIIHEVGHNFFPMIINSDERQWTWMDEGLNTFVQYLTEKEWDRDYPSRRGPAYKMVDYMKGDRDKISPIMTNSESIWQFGNNAYGKPATALNILRETILGRELFDYAFKHYSETWAFKHPTPADFFRAMEDASGVDLDWFWRGWFFTTEPVDIGIEDVKWMQVDTKNPDVENPIRKEQAESGKRHIGFARNRSDIPKSMIELKPELNDFYNSYDPYEVTSIDRDEYKEYLEELDADQKSLLNEGLNFYELSFRNVGGLPMPIIFKLTFTDGSQENHHIPAEIWKRDELVVRKVYFTEKALKSIEIDPYLETADIDESNNHWPPRLTPSRFELFERNQERKNPMQKAKR